MPSSPWLGRARACSALPRLQLELVANADPRGPIVFIARCIGDVCSGLSSLRVSFVPAQPAVPTPVAGSFSAKPVQGAMDQLAIFTPTSPLDPVGNYMVLDGTSGQPVTSFTVGAPGAPAPLDRATTVDGIDKWAAGFQYQCTVSAQDSIGACAPVTLFSWHERETGHATVTVSVPMTNGWLFMGAEGTLPENNVRWATTTDVLLRTDPGVENCVSLVAWNVLDDQREMRKVCKTGRTLSAAEQNFVLPTPDLGKCTQAPHLENSTTEAGGLLETWCRDRRAYCAKATMFPCGPLDSRCMAGTPTADAGVMANVQASKSDDAGPAQAPEASASPASSADDDADDGEGGCSLVRTNAGGDGLWLLALLLCVRWRRRD